MADDFVQLTQETSESNPAKVDVRTVTTGAGSVQRQVVAIGDDVSDNVANVDSNGNITISAADAGAVILALLEFLKSPTSQDPSTGRTRVVVENILAGLTLSNVTTVTTVATVNNVSQIAAFDAKQSLLFDASLTSWALLCRARYT